MGAFLASPPGLAVPTANGAAAPARPDSDKNYQLGRQFGTILHTSWHTEPFPQLGSPTTKDGRCNLDIWELFTEQNKGEEEYGWPPGALEDPDFLEGMMGSKNGWGWNLAHLAIINQDWEALDVLMTKNPDLVYETTGDNGPAPRRTGLHLLSDNNVEFYHGGLEEHVHLLLQAMAVSPPEALTALSVSPYAGSGGRTFMHDLCNSGKTEHLPLVIEFLIKGANSPLNTTIPTQDGRRAWVRDNLINKQCIKRKGCLDHLRRSVKQTDSTRPVFIYLEKCGAVCYEQTETWDSVNLQKKRESWQEYLEYRDANPRRKNEFTKDYMGYEWWRATRKGDRYTLITQKDLTHPLNPWRHETDMKYLIDQAWKVIAYEDLGRWDKKDMRLSIRTGFWDWYLDQSIPVSEVTLIHQLVQYRCQETGRSWKPPSAKFLTALWGGDKARATSTGTGKGKNVRPRHSDSSRPNWDGNAPRASSSFHTVKGHANHDAAPWGNTHNSQWVWGADRQDRQGQWQQTETWMEHRHQGQRCDDIRKKQSWAQHR